jgi:hypothetical protein
MVAVWLMAACVAQGDERQPEVGPPDAAVAGGEAAAESELPEKLKSAPANEWVKLYERDTGGRQSPIWYYDAQIGKFVLTGGAFGWPVHWDNEEFDLATGKMINAYPAGLPEGHGKPAAGPTQYPYPPKQGHGESGRWRKDKNNLLRVPTFAGYGASSQAYHQYAYDPEAKRVVLYCLNQTMAYDPQSRTWSNTGAGAFSKGHHMKWGSMAYDPVNKEIVSIGGSSFEAGGTPGTWVFTCATNKWAKLQPGSAAMRELNAEARQVEREGWDFLSALRNRFYMSESEAEAKVKLSERGQALAASLRKLAAAIESAKLDDVEKPAAARAAQKVTELLDTLQELQGKFDAAVDSPLLATMQQVHMKLDATEHNLDFEPAARAMSQMTYDPVNQVLVLFGGSGLDRQYADTWLYHCKQRRWEQRWPEKNPAPRAGHALLWLPKSKTVWLGGGFTLHHGRSYMYGDAYWHLPWEAWTYDVAKNEWKCIFHVPLPGISRGHGPDFNNPTKGWPWGDVRNIWPMAVGPDDTILFFKTVVKYSRRSAQVWAMQPDVAAASDELTAQHGVAPETLKFRGDGGWASYDPGFYDRVGKPDHEKTEAFYKNLPTNRWTHIGPPKGVDKCGWGTTAYDTDREQFLFWGGGHSEYKGANVFHYATRTGLWSSSCRPEIPLEWTGGFLARIEKSFRDRPHIPVHAYQIYAYDPPSGAVLFAKWSHLYVYDLARREFDPTPYKIPFPSGNVMRVALETTPAGVIAWAENGALWRYEKKTWKKLPYQGPKLGPPWGDGSGLVYDRERDCLWIANGGIVKYDIATGSAAALKIRKPKFSKFALWRESEPIPGTDLILLMRTFKHPDGTFKNLAVDVKQAKYFWVDLPYLTGGKPYKDKHGRNAPDFGWNSAMRWDPNRKLMWVHNPISFWVLKFEPTTAKLEEVKE